MKHRCRLPRITATTGRRFDCVCGLHYVRRGYGDEWILDPRHVQTPAWPRDEELARLDLIVWLAMLSVVVGAVLAAAIVRAVHQ